MLAQKISGLQNLLQNKIADQAWAYYNSNEPHEQPPDLLPIYVECMTMEFGEIAQLAGVPETLRALAIWTSTAIHHSDPGWRRECAYQQVVRQVAFFGTLFPGIVQALSDSDSDSD